MPIKLIVGLRNPGATYQYTRHNAGGWFVESLVQQQTVFKNDKKMQCELADLNLQGMSCRAILPTTFMNHSGAPVRLLCQFYRIEPTELLVVHDELDLPVGRIKLKSGGGHGGHNGLRDIISQIGSTAFHRLRIGIGHPGHKTLVHDYVLGKPSPADRELIENAISRVVPHTANIISGDMAAAMNLINI